MNNKVLKIKIEQGTVGELIKNCLGEFLFLTICYVIQLIFTKKFNLVVLVFFGIGFAILLIISVIIWFILKLKYINIDTSIDEVEIRKLFKIRKYKISDIKIKIFIQSDNELFLYTLMVFKNEKKIFSIHNNDFKNSKFSTKDFYLILCSHLNIEHVEKKLKNKFYN